jgi:hypothetical protein
MDHTRRAARQQSWRAICARNAQSFTAVCITWVVATGVFADRAAAQAPTRNSIVMRLRHVERLVRTMECTFTVVAGETPAADIPKIDEMRLRRLKPGPLDSYIQTKERARANSYRSHWWRDGVKEREEITRKTWGADGGEGVPSSSIQVYDGEVVRFLSDSSSELVGIIEGIDTAAWYGMNTWQPFAVLFEYQRTPYSELLAQSTNATIASVQRDGRAMVEVAFSHPKYNDHSFVLIFDHELLLIERRVIYYRPKVDRAPRVYQTQQFRRYESFTDSSGESFSFPREMEVRSIIGQTDDGTLFANYTDVFEFDDLRFNVDIPPERFVLEFPPEARVIDKLHGLGLLGPEPAGPSRSALTRSWRVPVSVGAATFLGLTAIIVLLRRALSRRDGPNSPH